MNSLKRPIEDAAVEGAAAERKRNCGEDNGDTFQLGSDMTLDGLPDLVLARIVYQTTEVKQKLRLAMTCRKLFNVVTRDKAAWPAKVHVTHGYASSIAARANRHPKNDAVLVTVGDAAAVPVPVDESQLLPATDLERLLSVMHLPAVCPVPVELHIRPVAGRRRQRQFIMQHVLPWLKKRKAGNKLLFSSVRLLFTYEEFVSCSQLLYVLCDTAVPVRLELFCCERKQAKGEQLWGRLEKKNKPLTSVRRLSLVIGDDWLGYLAGMIRVFPNATEVLFNLEYGMELWFSWPRIWSSFIESRAEPNRPHTLRIVQYFGPEEVSAIQQMQPGLPVDLNDSVRQMLTAALEAGPEVLAAIEEKAEVQVVYPGPTPARHNHILTFNLLMKQLQVEWTVEFILYE